MTCETVVRPRKGGANITIGGGSSKRITLDDRTVAKINDNRPRNVVQPRDTQVNVTDRPTRVIAGGRMGMQGPPGGADLHYTHVQAIPAAEWTIVHGLGKYPSVSVVDSADELVEGDVRYDSLNTLTLTFAGAFSGKAFCN